VTRIITDSCADLSQELIDRFNIDIVPLGVYINDVVFQDGIDIHTQDLFNEVAKTGILPKTSAPSVATYIEHFTGDEDVIYISISSKLSASNQNAHLAQKTIGKENVYIIDSLNLSTGIGLLVLAAAEMAQSGMKTTEIISQVESLKANVHTSFVVDTLDYIHKGGRCSATELLIGSLLNIRPVIEVRTDGTLDVKKKIAGSRKKALMSMVEDLKKDIAQVNLHRIFITHTLCEKDADFLKSEVEILAKFDEIHFTVAGSTIASHCGPKCIGILYLTK